MTTITTDIYYNGSIRLSDINGENIAEFMLMSAQAGDFVKCIPMFGMFEMYRHNMNHPVMVMAGATMPMESFLGYIANVTQASDPRYPYVMTRDSVNLRLLRGMSAEGIASLTMTDVQLVKALYRDYFVVDTGDVQE
jgi:hypothetical protein